MDSRDLVKAVLLGTVVLAAVQVGIAFGVRGPSLTDELAGLPGPLDALALAALLGLLTAGTGALLYEQWPWLRERLDADIFLAVAAVPPVPWLIVAVVGSAASRDAPEAVSGTGSYPPPPPGRQRDNRRAASWTPRSAP